jgi:hypothetical protein
LIALFPFKCDLSAAQLNGNSSGIHELKQAGTERSVDCNATPDCFVDQVFEIIAERSVRPYH